MLVYVPFLANVFGYVPPTGMAYGIAAAITIGYYALTQVVKIIYGIIIKNKDKPKFKLEKDQEEN